MLTASMALTINGVHFNDGGERRLVEKVFPAMFGAAAPAMDTPQAKQVREVFAKTQGIVDIDDSSIAAAPRKLLLIDRRKAAMHDD